MPPIPLDFSDFPVTKHPRELRCEQMNAQGKPFNVRDQNRQLSFIDCDGSTACKQTTTGSVKRSLDSLELTPSHKRCRFLTSTPIAEPGVVQEISSTNIIDAVEKLSAEPRLIADGTRANILPTIPGKHSDLSAISPETMTDVLDGVYDNRMEKVTIIDCRYPYEYNGGHIEGAVNLYTKEAIQKFLQESVTSSPNCHVLIFHCEFSSERGPKMYRFLRSLDRDLIKEHYPRLNFPEIYLLERGYKAFFYTSKEKCSPQTYTPMLHKEHKKELRHFRVKSKSWSAGDRPHKASIKGTGMRLRF